MPQEDPRVRALPHPRSGRRDTGKRVLVRVDLNVPMENGQVTDATRIERVAPTISEIADKGGKVDPARAFRPAEGARPEGCR